ncbi:DUF1365 domain-containing protein [Ningiella sp. W23]|uniref:DUF1365 domain-containing protein n=1 Tax=Ningiella sp. W23 TaxID=3023715 RepID=UPI0037578A00
MNEPSLKGALESAIYKGKVYHRRSVPKVHAFEYQIFLYWLKLAELERLSQEITSFSVFDSDKWSSVRFRRSDYLGDPNIPLQDAVLAKMNALNSAGANDKCNINELPSRLEGDVFLLGQVRTFGLYFSPVNFYYLRNAHKQFTHMLAEVSNTPWNERHCYLVDLSKQKDCEKAFHVSPFNPIDMTYRWQIQQPSDSLRLHLSCLKQTKHFEASIDMQKLTLDSRQLKKMLRSIPSMTLKTVGGIYWQALKLFFKRVPIYTHP